MAPKGWNEKQREDDITDMMILLGDDILLERGRTRNEDGNWSDEDMVLLENVCRERLQAISAA